MASTSGSVNAMYIFENFSASMKATSGRPAYSPALYQIKSAIAKLLVSFWCQVKIREGQAEETAYKLIMLIHYKNSTLQSTSFHKVFSSRRSLLSLKNPLAS